LLGKKEVEAKDGATLEDISWECFAACPKPPSYSLSNVEMIEVRHRPWEWRPEAGAADIQE
jgi:hypothetical protein